MGSGSKGQHLCLLKVRNLNEYTEIFLGGLTKAGVPAPCRYWGCYSYSKQILISPGIWWYIMIIIYYSSLSYIILH